MASNRSLHNPQDPFDGSTSILLPTVSLHDWWLIRPANEPDGKRVVGVAGFTSPKNELASQPVHLFKSAPITRIYNCSTLETADNVCVDIIGCMNVARAAENGFSTEVCEHFVSGFPLNWKNLIAEQGNNSAAFKTSPDQVSRSEKHQKSPRRQKRKKDNQPNTESQVPTPVSRSKEDQTSPGKENQPRTRTRRCLFTENVAGDLSSDLPEDAMEKVRVDPSSAFPLVKHKNEEPPSAPPLVKPRRPSRCQIGTLGKGDVRRQTTTHVAIPPKKEMVTPDSFKRSRSGRILLPPLAFWRNELPIYDANRNIAGVRGLDKAVDSKDIGNMSRRK